jgi:putative ABC transport system ATP-binding protein
MIARLEKVSKEYTVGDQRIVALEPTDFILNSNQLTLVIGPSGSGKTTLVSLIGCVIYPSSGKLEVDGQLINSMNENQLANLRLQTIGFVFQNFNLIAPLTAEENVMMPLSLQGIPAKEAKVRTEEALQIVSMIDRRKSLPKQLSGGQQQRIAIARALVSDPKIVLCDEPTASLDSQSLVVVMKELRTLADQGKAVVVVTHDPRLKQYAHRIVEVNNGRVQEATDASTNLEPPH